MEDLGGPSQSANADQVAEQTQNAVRMKISGTGLQSEVAREIQRLKVFVLHVHLMRDSPMSLTSFMDRDNEKKSRISRN